MNDLIITYALPKKIKIISIACGIFFGILSAIIAVQQAMANKFAFLFIVGAVGVLLAIVLIAIVSQHHPEFQIAINKDEFAIKQRKQRIDGVILWENVSQVGIGLSHLVLTTPEKTYKLDLGNIKYNDLKAIKTKLLEVCESRSIPYSNL